MQTEKDIDPHKESLAQLMFDHIPVGVGSQGLIPTTQKDLEAVLEMGMDWSVREVGNPDQSTQTTWWHLWHSLAVTTLWSTGLCLG